jgi:hypothetical protein
MPDTGLLTDGILNGALNDFLNAIQMYFPLLLVWGLRMLWSITFVGFGYALIQAVSNQDWYGTLMAFGWGLVRIFLVYAVMENIESWGGAFPLWGTIVGTSVSGVSPYTTTPSGLYEMGLRIVSMMIHARSLGAWFDLIADLQFVLLIIATQICWFAAGCIYLWILIEVKWYVAKGPITICFATFDRTWPILENWAITLLQVSIRLLAAMLVIAIGTTLAHFWTASEAHLGLTMNKNQIQYGAMQLVESVIFFYAMWTLPKKAAQLIMSKGASGVGHSGGEGAEAAFAVGATLARSSVRVITKI